MDLKGNCQTCGVPMVGNYAWKQMDADQRAQARAAGYHRQHSSTKCAACCDRESKRRRRAKVLAEREAAGISGPYTAELIRHEWFHLRDVRLSVQENIRRLAPRMDLTPGALEAQLSRAGIRVDTTPEDVAA